MTQTQPIAIPKPDIFIAVATAAKRGEAADHIAIGRAAGVRSDNMKVSLESFAAQGLITLTPFALTPRGHSAMRALAGQGPDQGPDGGPDAAPPAPSVLLDQIAFSGFNPRKQIDPAQLQELARDISEKGILQPVLVRPIDDPRFPYELVFGERRLRALKLCAANGWPVCGMEPTAYPLPVQIRTLTDGEVRRIQIVENEQRAEVHWLDQGDAYAEIVRDEGISAAQLAQQVNLEPRVVQQRIQVAAGLTESERAAAFAGTLGFKQALQTLRDREKSKSATDAKGPPPASAAPASPSGNSAPTDSPPDGDAPNPPVPSPLVGEGQTAPGSAASGRADGMRGPAHADPFILGVDLGALPGRTAYTLHLSRAGVELLNAILWNHSGDKSDPETIFAMQLLNTLGEVTRVPMVRAEALAEAAE